MTNRRTRRSVLAGTGAALALAGCLGDEDDADGNADGDSAADGDGSTSDDEADLDWRETTLEDLTTGDSFTIAEIDDPVVVHTFATHCPTCNSQQDEIAESAADIGGDVEFVDLAIRGSAEPETVREHAEENGYGWRFAMASEEFTGALVDEFGQEIAVHAQSPLVVVCSDGSTDTIEKGSSANEIRNAVDGCR